MELDLDDTNHWMDCMHGTSHNFWATLGRTRAIKLVHCDIEYKSLDFSSLVCRRKFLKVGNRSTFVDKLDLGSNVKLA